MQRLSRRTRWLFPQSRTYVSTENPPRWPHCLGSVPNAKRKTKWFQLDTRFQSTTHHNNAAFPALEVGQSANGPDGAEFTRWKSPSATQVETRAAHVAPADGSHDGRAERPQPRRSSRTRVVFIDFQPSTPRGTQLVNVSPRWFPGLECSCTTNQA